MRIKQIVNTINAAKNRVVLLLLIAVKSIAG
jgi:hypothetical protein